MNILAKKIAASFFSILKLCLHQSKYVVKVLFTPIGFICYNLLQVEEEEGRGKKHSSSNKYLHTLLVPFRCGNIESE